MATMTIGEFSARTRLSPKALRLYDRLGLLTPVGVDPVNGYRRYAEEQVADAVLVGIAAAVGHATAGDRDGARRRPGRTVVTGALVLGQRRDGIG